MNEKPLVTVICLCYNQAPFVAASLRSILNQTYSNLEIIVCDDASTDASAIAIKEVVRKYPKIRFIQNEKNLGNCTAFNRAFASSTGQFIIDLAADDLLLPNRIELGVQELLHHGRKYGVHYTNAMLIDQDGEPLRNHDRENGPSGDLYLDVIQRYFICPTTMMIRRDVLESIGGYNERLTYEDFDFWVRSTRKFEYLYSPTLTAKKRVVNGSLSSEQYHLFNRHQYSTLKVCETILSQNKSKEENNALRKRLYYEIWQCIRSLNFHLVGGFLVVWVRSYF